MRASSAPTAAAPIEARSRIAQRRERLAKLALHATLVVGCVVFSFPFYWLLSTSVKEREEIQRDPPVWVPALPHSATASPFIEAGQYAEPRVPEGVPRPQFSAFWPAVERGLWQWVEANHPEVPARFPMGQVRGPLVNVLWDGLQAGTPPDTWRLSRDGIAAKVTGALKEDDFQRAWYQVYRSFGFRELVVEDTGFVRHRLPRDFDQLGAWKPVDGRVDVHLLAGDAKPALEAAYSFEGGDSVSLQLEAPVDVASGDFRGVVLPVRHDHSWSSLWLTVEIGPRRLQATEPLVLTDRAWLDATFRLPAEHALGFEVHDFVELKDAGSADLPEGRLRVTARLDQNSALGAVRAKCARNYQDALRYVPFWAYLGNTVFVVVLSIAGQLFSCSLIAFSFARLRWPLRDQCFAVLLATMMLPGQVTMVPQFLIFKYLGWYNTLYPLWLPSFFGSAFFIFMLRQFMKGIPNDLEDAAKIDGCSYFMIYWKIMLPLIKPALAAIAIFTFMGAWNNFMGPLIYVSDQRLYPLALGLFQFRSEHGADFGMLMAASALMTLPVVAIFFAAQRYFIQGVTLTGIKG